MELLYPTEDQWWQQRQWSKQNQLKPEKQV